MPDSASRSATILYIRPSDRRRTAIAEYADHFERALRLVPGARVVALLPPDLPERIDSRADRDRVVGCARASARSWRRSGSEIVVHVELGNSLHREFWAGYALMRSLPRARFFSTIHDPPTLCSNPYRYVRTEFEGRTPFRPLDIALTKAAETAVAGMKRRIERRFVRRCRTLLALTEKGLDRLQTEPVFRGPGLARIEHVSVSGPSGADASAHRSGGQLAGPAPCAPPAIGMFCFLGPRKGVENLVEAFDALSSRLAKETGGGSGPRLAIFGAAQHGLETASYFERVRARIDRSPFRDRIDFSPGYVDEAERDRRLAAIDILVLPAAPVERVVFCSGSLIRAMGIGKAIVASRTGAVEEEISHGQNGLLYPPGDCAALADQLYALVADAALRERFARAAAAHIRSEHSPQALAPRLAAFYEIDRSR